jgi:four helix bundle protein
MSYRDFTSMPVWKTAFNLLLEIYKVTKAFPSDERFGLTSDIRRAANSIVHNIAEGFGRYEAKDKTRFYKISRGSAYELMSQIMVSHALLYIENENLKEQLLQNCRQIISDLSSIIKTLEKGKGLNQGQDKSEA